MCAQRARATSPPVSVALVVSAPATTVARSAGPNAPGHRGTRQEGARYAFTEASSPAFTDRGLLDLTPVSEIVCTWMVAEADRVGWCQSR